MSRIRAQLTPSSPLRALRREPPGLSRTELPPEAPLQAGYVASKTAPVIPLRPPSAAVLRHALDEVFTAARAKVPAAPADPHALLHRIMSIGRGESIASAVLAEAESRLATDLTLSRKEHEALEGVVQRSLKALREIGAAYAATMPVFAATVHGGEAWPTIVEDSPKGRLYVNSFKSKEPLTFEQKAAIYATKVEKFEKQGGRFDRDVRTPSSIDELEAGCRHDYVLLGDGRIRSAKRGPDLPDPGHALLAEGGPDFHDVRVAMAGELRIVRDDTGRAVACVAACSSGHFKPYYEDVGRMEAALAAIGVPRDRVITSGGPDDPAAMALEITKRFGLPDPSAMNPPTVEEARAALRTQGARSYLLRAS